MILFMECDQSYLEQVIVFLESFFAFHPNESISLLIADRDWEEDNKKVVHEYLFKYESKVIFIDVKDDLEYFNYPNRDAAIMLCVFSLADHVDYSRVLYVDVDMVINGSLYDIWNLEMGDNFIAGTLDCNLAISRAASGIDVNDPYFNSGVSLINLDAMRKHNIKKRTFDYIKSYDIKKYKKQIYDVTRNWLKTWEVIYSNANNIYYHDQGIWANLSRGHAIVLHPKYNVLMPEMIEPIEKYLDEWKGFWGEEEIRESRENPAVIHFSGNKYCKPWNDICNHPKRDLYYKYKKRTPFKDVPLIHCEENIKFRKRDLINKLPKTIRIAIYMAGYYMERMKGKMNDSN